ncbi:MAG: hypothetical protein R2862_10900 [Thermoanaerobaculia bacterium]
MLGLPAREVRAARRPFGRRRRSRRFGVPGRQRPDEHPLPSPLPVDLSAERGQHGLGANRTGKSGADLEIQVPLGTVVFDEGSGEQLGEILADGEKLEVAPRRARRTWQPAFRNADEPGTAARRSGARGDRAPAEARAQASPTSGSSVSPTPGSRLW